MPATCNSTLEDMGISEVALWKGYNFHHFGLLLSAIFGGIATLISLYLIMMHSLHYLKPREQRHIIRILLLIPVYSVVSFLSYLYFRQAIYYDVLEGCYEAFAIASFFSLLCNYIAPNIHDQKDYFRALTPKNWFAKFNGFQYFFGKSFRLAIRGRWREAADYGENFGPFRKPRSGLTWFNIIWTGVFQYCVIRVFFTIVSVIAQAFNVYCDESLSPAFAHVWVEVFEAVSVTIAMICLIQFYIQLREDLSEHKPFLKILSIKLVIFFSFWQTILISFLSSSNGPLKPSKQIGYQDINVGIPAMLMCIEMAIFAVMYLFAFPWKIYSIKKSYSDPLNVPGSGFSGDSLRYQGGPFGLYALADAFNPWDIIKAVGRGFKFAFIGYKRREQDVSYQRGPGGKLSATGYTGVAGDTNIVGGVVGVADPSMAGARLSTLHRSDSDDSYNDDDPFPLHDRPAATHLKPLDMGMGGRTGSSPYSEDTAGLLSNTSRMPRSSPQHHHPSSSHQSLDVLPPPRSSFEPAAAHYDDQQDTSYHPGFGPAYAPSGPTSGGAQPHANAAPYRGASASPLHPALRRDDEDDNAEDEVEGAGGGTANAGWNFFAGAMRDGADDDEHGHHQSRHDEERDLGDYSASSRHGRR